MLTTLAIIQRMGAKRPQFQSTINNQLSGEIDDGVANVVNNFGGEDEVKICAKDGTCNIWGEELPNVEPKRRSNNPGQWIWNKTEIYGRIW